MNRQELRKLITIFVIGAMPFATVSSCDMGPGGGSFFLDRGVDSLFYGPGDVIVDDYYYDDYYYEDDYYYDDYYYDDGYYDDGYYDDGYYDFWDFF